MCPAGYYCPEGTDNYVRFPCAAGTYAAWEGNARALGLSQQAQCLACPVGHYCQPHTVRPQPCPAGSYMPTEGATHADTATATAAGAPASAACLPCAAGSQCPLQGMSAMLACPAGTYSPAKSDSCFACREGRVCPGPLTTQAQYEAAYCPPGRICAGLDSAPAACPLGDFCFGSGQAPFVVSQTWERRKCPAGTYAAAAGLAVESDCTVTPVGYFADLQASVQSMLAARDCEFGHGCPAGSRSAYQVPCEAGSYQDERAKGACKPCPAGATCTGATFRPLVCPPGRYCPAGAREPQLCPPGTFSAAVGRVAPTDCSPCLAGHYCAQGGLEFPDGLCDPGYYCIAGAASSAPTDGVTGSACPQGGYCELGSRAPELCPPGTYNGETGGRSRYDCTACPPGKYCPGTSNPAPAGDCAAGYYCPGKSQTPTQLTTLPGYYSEAGWGAPLPCPPGTYGPFTAQSACLPCPAGFYCPNSGMSDIYLDCPAGHYCGAGSAAPLACPAGTYSNELNRAAAGECKPCSPGRYCAATGLEAPTGVCEAGYFCVTGAQHPSPTASATAGPCPGGHYCPAATAWPLPCPAGTFSSAQGATLASACAACTAGSFCATAGLMTPTGACEPGFFCPAGSRQSRPAASFCAAGQFCPAGSALPKACPAGSY